MGRDYGQLVLPGNIERNIAAPLDATMKVSMLSGLTHPDTFKSISDGIDYSYIGMFTIVVDDHEDNNGLYILKQFPTTDINNWIKLQASFDSNLNTKAKNIVDAINELNVKTNDPTTDNDIAPTLTVVDSNGKYLLFNDVDDFLNLDSKSITEYTISLLISGTTEKCFLKKIIEFSANTISSNNIYTSHAIITDEDAFNANIINAKIDVQQLDNSSRIAIYMTTDIECNVFLSVAKTTGANV